MYRTDTLYTMTGGPANTERSLYTVFEKAIEKALRNKVKAAGGEAIKFTSPGTIGVPDRLVLWPGGRAEFVEIKAPGGRLTAIQTFRHEQIRKLGFTVLVVSNNNEVEDYVLHAKTLSEALHAKDH